MIRSGFGGGAVVGCSGSIEVTVIFVGGRRSGCGGGDDFVCGRQL